MQEKHLNDSLSQENSVTGGPAARFSAENGPKIQKNDQNLVTGGSPAHEIKKNVFFRNFQKFCPSHAKFWGQKNDQFKTKNS